MCSTSGLATRAVMTTRMQMKMVRKASPVHLIPAGGGISTGFLLAAMFGNPPKDIAHSAKQHNQKIAFGTIDGKASSASPTAVETYLWSKLCVAQQHRPGIIAKLIKGEGNRRDASDHRSRAAAWNGGGRLCGRGRDGSREGAIGRTRES